MSIDDATPTDWDRVRDKWVHGQFQTARGVANIPFGTLKNKQGGGLNFMETSSNLNKGAGYQQRAMLTAKRRDFSFDLMHSALGLSSEAGEFTDAVKKTLVYGKALDKENLLEELGDLCWFIALACEVLNVEMTDIMEQNIEKLKKRYPEKYSDELAIQRLDKARSNPF